MKVLFDSCMSPVVADELRAQGFDVVWVGDWPADPGDAAVLAQAFREARALITIDTDFGELAVAQRQPHVGIVRLAEIPPEEHATCCRETLLRYANELAAGAIVTVEKTRTRVRLEVERA